MKLEDFLQKNYGYNPDVKNKMQTYINQWKSWYEGNVKSFHNYWAFNGLKKKKRHRFTMNMPKEMSEDWSDIIWSEKCEISMKDDKSQAQFEELINALDLYSLINQAIEKSGALGTESAVTSVYDLIEDKDNMILDVSNAKTRIDLVDIDWIYPLSWSNKGITECAFGSVEYKSGIKYIVLSVHKKAEDGTYHIYNHLFQETNNCLTEIKDNEETFKDFPTKSDIPWFAIFKPNLTNNLFNNSPFGIPHYANSIDNLKAVDISFDALKNEIDSRRRTFVRANMLNYDSGEQKMVFDEDDDSIYVLPKDATKEDLIQSDSDDLRTDKQINTLNTNLSILGNKCGFGMNYYTYDGNNLQTATAVISSNSKLFRRKKKLEVGYESAIYDLVRAICYASSRFGNYNINTDGMAIKFDDSIIEDKEAESNRALREKQSGVMSAVEYRMKIYGETEEIAKQKIDEIKAEEPRYGDMLGNNAEE